MLSRNRRAWLAALVLLAMLGGCRTTEEKLLDESMALYTEALETLNAHSGSPSDGVKALVTLEEQTRDRRAELKKRFEAALADLSPDAKRAFQEEAKKRVEPFTAQLGVAIKRYPEDRQVYIRQLVGKIVR